MEREAIGGNPTDFVSKLKRFVEEDVLEMPIFDTFIIAIVLGTLYLAKDYFDVRKIRVKNNLVRARENGNIIPLNPKIVKEIGDIASSKF